MNIRRMFSPMFEISKHMELVNLTVNVLKNDGKGEAVVLYTDTDDITGKSGLELLAEGVKDADLPYFSGYILHLMHFHHPWSHRGYLSKSSAADQTAKIYSLAINRWQNGYKGCALYQLGRALHLIQDINIPQHAGISAFKGHGDFERWLTVHGNQFTVQTGGYYEWEQTFSLNGTNHYANSKNVYDWIDYGSHTSYPYFMEYFFDGNYTEAVFPEIAAKVMPNVLRLSAGFLAKFAEETKNITT